MVPEKSQQKISKPDDGWTPQFSSWRHGGWYVHNVRYPSGAVGCVSRNYADKKWRIVCDPRPFETRPTFKTRDEAARAERDLVNSEEFQTLHRFTQWQNARAAANK